MDWFYASLGVALLVGGFLLGRLNRRTPPHLVCACRHIYSDHQDGGHCQAVERRGNADGYRGYEYVPCVCTTYIGPAPEGPP